MSDPFEDLLPDLEGLVDQDERAAVERAHRVTQLTQHPNWSVYVGYLLDISQADRARILSGSVSNIEDYRKLVGRVQGIHMAINAADMLAEQVLRMQQQAAGDEEEVEFDRVR